MAKSAGINPWTEIGVQVVDTRQFSDSPESAVRFAKNQLPSLLKEKCGVMETRVSTDNHKVAFRLTCKVPIHDEISLTKTLGFNVALDDFAVKKLLKETGKAQPMTFYATGWVEESVGAEITAKNAEDALKYADKNRSGSADIDWDYETWASGVRALQIMDVDRLDFPLSEMLV